jgi:hypothetical protein
MGRHHFIPLFVLRHPAAPPPTSGQHSRRHPSTPPAAPYGSYFRLNWDSLSLAGAGGAGAAPQRQDFSA